MAGGDIPLASPLEGDYEVAVPAAKPLVTADPGRVIVPGSGEIVVLAELDENTLGRLLLAAKDFEDQLDGLKKRVAVEVLERMDRRAKWTFHVGGIKLTGKAPGATEISADLLSANLQPLVDDGTITAEAKEAAVEPVTKLKVRKAGAKALEKLGGRVAKAVKQATRPADDAKRSVRVEVE